MKDSNYHGFTPTLQVMLNIKTMLQNLIKSVKPHDSPDNYMSEMEDSFQQCLLLIEQEIEESHSEIVRTLAEVIDHRYDCWRINKKHWK